MKLFSRSVRFMDGGHRRSTINFARSLDTLLVGVLLLVGCDTSINSSLVVPDGESRTGALTSVNGDVTIGKDCTIEGSSTSVNGSIKIEVTGGSSIEGDVLVKRDVDVRLILRDGGKVLGKVDGAEVVDE